MVDNANDPYEAPERWTGRMGKRRSPGGLRPERAQRGTELSQSEKLQKEGL